MPDVMVAPLISEEEIQRRLEAGDILMDARQIARLVGGEPPTTELWVRRHWPHRVEIAKRKVRWWRSTVIATLAAAQQR